MPIFKKSSVPVLPLLGLSLLGFWWVKSNRVKRTIVQVPKPSVPPWFKLVVCDEHLGHEYCIYDSDGFAHYTIDNGEPQGEGLNVELAIIEAKRLIESL